MRRNFLEAALLLFALVALADADLSEDLIRKLCPKDKEFCAGKVAAGECFGKSLRAEVLQRKCTCSCNAVHHDRIQTCCRAVGQQEMKFCLPLCGYNTTTEELGSSLGIKCVSQLTTWAYCAADAADNTQCCAQRGVPLECRSFCKGDVPTCDMQSIFSYQPCLQHMRSIIDCQKEGLGPQPRYDRDWTAECEWEGR